jgi:predicted glycosyltransferase
VLAVFSKGVEDMKNIDRKNIWIDLDNSPHVPFFVPIIEELKARGYTVILTARDCSQTCGLADRYKLKYERIGRHFGKRKIFKIIGLLFRVVQLVPFLLKERPGIALSHGSRTQILASKFFGIQSILIADYEHANRTIHPDWLIVPDVVYHNAFLGQDQVLTYSGIKEDVYAPNFKPDAAILDELGLSESDLVITIRPPATDAHYHNPKSDELFTATIEHLRQQQNVRLVILPRNAKQAASIGKLWPDLIKTRTIIIPDHVIDGLELIWYSDFVISGGGTMNREAAALGIPVYSIFRGKIGAVDSYLARLGRLTLIESVEDLRSKIKPIRRLKGKETGIGDKSALKDIVASIEKIVEKG